MLGIFSNVMKVATRNREVTHADMLSEHEQRKRDEEQLWKAHHHWYKRSL